MKRRYLALLLILFPTISHGNVVINEIAWMGQEDGYSKEWIELYNDGTNSVDLTGWKLAITKKEITLTGTIGPDSMYLLEKDNDSTISDEKADFIFKKSLSNKGEYLELSDKEGVAVDSVDCSGGWFSGDNKKKLTMEKTAPDKNGNDRSSWKNSNEPGGTPNKENSQKMAPLESRNTENKNREEKKTSPLTYLIATTTSILSAGAVLLVKISSR
jgi:hypothetical protein